MRHYCTYFDCTFLVRGLALYRSLVEHSEAFSLWVLCVDDVTYDALIQINAPGLEPIRTSELESVSPGAVASKANPDRVDYFFSYLPALPRYILKREPAIKAITFLDSDIFFFSDPAPVLNEMAGSSFLALEHQFPTAVQNLGKYGRFKVGFLSFGNDTAGRGCLELWWQQCVEWHCNRAKDRQAADQKYLEQWPARFKDAQIIEHLGANVAPWNVGTLDVQHANGSVTVNGIELIFYHFHRLRILTSFLCDPGLVHFQKTPASQELREWVYKPYLRALGDTWDWVAGQTSGLAPGYAQVRPGRYTYSKLVRDAVNSFLHGQLLVSVRGFR